MAFNWGNAATGTMYGGLIPGAIAGFLGGDREDPEKEANRYLGQIEGRINPYYNPFIDAGRRTDPLLEDQYRRMFSNPNELLNNISKGYTESPGYKFRLNQGESAISNAQAAGGLAGSQQHQQMAGDLAEKLAGEDYEKYLDRVMGIFGGGQKGLEGISNRGYSAGTSLADSIANILGQQAQYAYAGAAGRNASNARDLENFYGGLGSLTSGVKNYFGG